MTANAILVKQTYFGVDKVDRIKLGIIGLGLAWERLHAPALKRLTDRFEIVAVCDTDKEKALNVSRWLGIGDEGAYSDYNQMLTRPDIEAVEVLVPIRETFECASAVIKCGKHLICEKPFAATPSAARDLIHMRDKMNVKVLVAENIRYEEENTLIKRLITEGHIGNPIYFIDNHIVEYRKQAQNGGFAQTEWRQHPDFYGGVMLDSGVHHVARMRYLFGNIISLCALGRPTRSSFSPYSCVNALFGFPDNVSGHYSFFMLGKETQAPLVGLRIFGTHGEIYLEERECGYVNISYKDGRSEAISYSPSQGYYHELEDFHTALRLGGRIESTPEKALGDIEAVFAMIDSIRVGEIIRPTMNGSFENSHSRVTKVYMSHESSSALNF